MKLAVLATGPTLNHLIAAHTRQAIYVISIDTDTMKYEAKPNDPKLLDFPLGRMLFAKLLAQEGIETVVTGYCSDTLCRVLDGEGINVTTGTFGFVGGAVRNFMASASTAAS
jgi:predicted Fe-Mo cluster-binding NifX family protein